MNEGSQAFLQPYEVTLRRKGGQDSCTNHGRVKEGQTSRSLATIILEHEPHKHNGTFGWVSLDATSYCVWEHPQNLRKLRWKNSFRTECSRQSIAGMLLVKPLGKTTSQSYAAEVRSREHRRVPLSTDASVTWTMVSMISARLDIPNKYHGRPRGITPRCDY